MARRSFSPMAQWVGGGGTPQLFQYRFVVVDAHHDRRLANRTSRTTGGPLTHRAKIATQLMQLSPDCPPPRSPKEYGDCTATTATARRLLGDCLEGCCTLSPRGSCCIALQAEPIALQLAQRAEKSMHISGDVMFFVAQWARCGIGKFQGKHLVGILAHGSMCACVCVCVCR